ncbi:DUF4251 domain-containing protein [Terrimonas sp. NA20]|uniref:DUF4251 domain-containing protein n=1 Tax=Terrimonas ginsenosidimutans TaxID=2908004 RepID=A0ABS9KTP5_9BACT|nr:DUF4251 domain-containing protein [Terrimonas ginsenosidimutans]MCG2615654.1 DUF4251 domain-containing protein [Terrimonas ginsenosidimutans]
MSKFNKILPVLLLTTMLASFKLTEAQNMDSAVVRQKVQGKQFTFIAQTANPMRGRNIQLTSLYDLRVSGDSVIAALPYFGRAFSAPVNPSDNGISFTSVNAEYRSTYRKKRWEISIKPKESQTVSEMNLTIYPNGRASLQVNSNYRQPISFNGILSDK